MEKETFESPTLRALGIEKLPFGNDIVLTGPPGIGKSIFCTNVICDCLKQENQNNVVFATFDVSPKDLRVRLSEQYPEGNGFEKIIFIDGYSWLLGEINEKYHVSHLSNLNDLSVKIHKSLNDEKQHHILFFDSISTLFVYNQENEIIRFLQINMARIKQSNSIAFWTVGEKIHTPEFYNFLRHLADGTIEMRFEENSELKRFIRIHTLKGLGHKTKWLPFNIQGNGRFIINTEAC